MTTPAPGLVLVYTGEGKGKTTAALGLAFRALGRGLGVAVLQFVKGGWETGERRLAERGLPGLEWHVMGEGFTWEGKDPAVHAEAARAGWAKARALLEAGAHDVVILDEVTLPLAHGWIDCGELLGVLRGRRAGMHVVLTGRGAPAALVEAADLVSEMRAVKHPFERGVMAVPGVDY
ncbi:MAG TPA: cob(I)yrinic acid a,c-diamide adenosyltransferase [Anaeromyxobacteraceae bacterium]|nr:cob(I)yrinic acid a,c-diamide adenosyltransferase [Anaeromyxobacteraceae bacterium]